MIFSFTLSLSIFSALWKNEWFVDHEMHTALVCILQLKIICSLELGFLRLSHDSFYQKRFYDRNQRWFTFFFLGRINHFLVDSLFSIESTIRLILEFATNSMHFQISIAIVFLLTSVNVLKTVIWFDSVKSMAIFCNQLPAARWYQQWIHVASLN